MSKQEADRGFIGSTLVVWFAFAIVLLNIVASPRDLGYQVKSLSYAGDNLVRHTPTAFQWDIRISPQGFPLVLLSKDAIASLRLKPPQQATILFQNWEEVITWEVAIYDDEQAEGQDRGRWCLLVPRPINGSNSPAPGQERIAQAIQEFVRPHSINSLKVLFPGGNTLNLDAPIQQHPNESAVATWQ